MEFIEQKIKGVFLIKRKTIGDERGKFWRHFCKEEFDEAGIDFDLKQSNISYNAHKGTLRGFHYQNSPFPEGKLMRVMEGKIYDIVVDLRKDSPTFKQWLSFELSKDDEFSLVIPKGCANAFYTLEDNTIVLYFHSEFYHPETEMGVRYNDPQFNFEWPAPPETISEKDKSIPDFDDVKNSVEV